MHPFIASTLFYRYRLRETHILHSKKRTIKGDFRPSLFLVLREEVGMIMCVSNAVASWDLTLRVLLQKLREKMTPE